MEQWKITPGALKAAWKMVRTIASNHSITDRDLNTLLILTSIISLEELKHMQMLEWKKPPPPDTTLVFDKDFVRMKEVEKFLFTLKENYPSPRIDRLFDLAEEILNRYDLVEEEKATLFTALPCLGLAALQDYLVWKRQPPFLELG